MPSARPKSESVAPAQLAKEEASFIADTVRRYYGEDAVLRNFGPDPTRLDIHVETGRDVGLAKYDCIGILMTRIDRQIDLTVTKRGTRIAGPAKLAYRNGEIF